MGSGLLCVGRTIALGLVLLNICVEELPGSSSILDLFFDIGADVEDSEHIVVLNIRSM